MKRTTRILAIVMAAVLALSMLPVFTMALTPAEIVDAAYALEPGATLDGTYTLTGKIISVDTVYNSKFGNVTVTIEVPGCEDKPIQCYRLAGNGADIIAEGFTITVTGTLTKYAKYDKETNELLSTTVEFAQGCTLDSYIDPNAPDVPSDPKQIVAEAYALGKDETLPYTATLTGKIVSVDDPYSAQYGNITVSIEVEGCEGKPIKCYRLKGEHAEELAPGDTITVTGNITNYKGNSVQFKQGCTLDNWIDGGEDLPEPPETMQEIVDEAYALEPGKTLLYTATLEGEVISIEEPYSEQYGNICFTIVVKDREDKPIVVYRAKGEGIENLTVGQIATVTGNLKNYVTTDSETGDTTSTIELVNGIVDEIKDPAPDHGLIGDVTGDTKINMADVAKAFAHVRNKSKLTDEGALVRADATGDGKINMADIARIFAHVRGKNPLA